MSTDTTISVCAGRPYGHVPGHSYRDVDITVRRCGRRFVAELVVTWGSAQGYDEEHGRLEYSSVGGDWIEAIEGVADEARDAADPEDDDLLGYIATAKTRAIREACALCDAE